MRTFAALFVSIVVSGAGLLDDPHLKPEDYPRVLLEAHNKERASEKLGPLTLDPRLTKAAGVHAHDMARHKTMSHEGSDKSHPADRVAKQAYHYVLVGENVAQGQETVPEVMKAWMNSPGHRANILGDFTQMGASVFRDEDGSPFWCVDFGRPIPKLDPEAAAKDLLERINKARSEADKPAVQSASKLQKAAQGVAKGLAQANKLESDTVDAFKLIAQEKYRFETVSQSLANGSPTAEDFLKRMLERADQKEQFLGDFKEVGIGYAQAEDETPYWCVLLAKPAKVGR